MAITFSTTNAILAINDKKINQIFSTNNLKEATKAESISDIVDLIIDWFKGGVKREAIKELFLAVQNVKNTNDSCSELNRLERFIELRNMALPEYYSKFTLEITPKDINQDWGYKLKVGDLTLYQCDKVFEKTRNLEERNKISDFHAKNIAMKLQEAFIQTGDFSDKEFLNASIRCAVDGNEKQHALRAKMDDNAYGKKNLIDIGEGGDSSEFIAFFKENKEVVFSNRTSSNNELRGNNLMNLLLNGDYRNLREAFLSQYRTENDFLLKGTTQPTKRNFYDQVINNYPSLSKDEIFDLNDKIKNINVGNTTLGKLWGISSDHFHDELYLAANTAASIEFFKTLLNTDETPPPITLSTHPLLNATRHDAFSLANHTTNVADTPPQAGTLLQTIDLNQRPRLHTEAQLLITNTDASTQQTMANIKANIAKMANVLTRLEENGKRIREAQHQAAGASATLQKHHAMRAEFDQRLLSRVAIHQPSTDLPQVIGGGKTQSTAMPNVSSELSVTTANVKRNGAVPSPLPQKASTAPQDNAGPASHNKTARITGSSRKKATVADRPIPSYMKLTKSAKAKRVNSPQPK
ncbi:hypothetical protein [Symbiopectobacterium purcellii]|uniref:hypothetical protein n=1 Tax=Symbiopectobacterium purcellii TaxID=2871826 RepID=UPI003F866C0A